MSFRPPLAVAGQLPILAPVLKTLVRRGVGIMGAGALGQQVMGAEAKRKAFFAEGLLKFGQCMAFAGEYLRLLVDLVVAEFQLRLDLAQFGQHGDELLCAWFAVFGR